MVTDQPDFSESWLSPFEKMFKNDIIMIYNSKSFDVNGVVKDALRYQRQIEKPDRHIDIKAVVNRIFKTQPGVSSAIHTDVVYALI